MPKKKFVQGYGALRTFGFLKIISKKMFFKKASKPTHI